MGAVCFTLSDIIFAQIVCQKVTSYFVSIRWWNKESEILNSHLKCFSLEKHIGVRRKEDTVNHATSYEILCVRKKTRE